MPFCPATLTASTIAFALVSKSPKVIEQLHARVPGSRQLRQFGHIVRGRARQHPDAVRSRALDQRPGPIHPEHRQSADVQLQPRGRVACRRRAPGARTCLHLAGQRHARNRPASASPVSIPQDPHETVSQMTTEPHPQPTGNRATDQRLLADHRVPQARLSVRIGRTCHHLPAASRSTGVVSMARARPTATESPDMGA
jgi:hypothetical protein